MFLISTARRGKLVALRSRATLAPWDPLTSELHCTKCGRIWIVGLCLWHKRKQAGANAGLPRDQVPDRDELAQIRQQTGALVMAEPLVRDNLHRIDTTTVAAECCCSRLAPPQQYTRLWNPACPIHDS